MEIKINLSNNCYSQVKRSFFSDLLYPCFENPVFLESLNHLFLYVIDLSCGQQVLRVTWLASPSRFIFLLPKVVIEIKADRTCVFCQLLFFLLAPHLINGLLDILLTILHKVLSVGLEVNYEAVSLNEHIL